INFRSTNPYRYRPILRNYQRVFRTGPSAVAVVDNDATDAGDPAVNCDSSGCRCSHKLNCLLARQLERVPAGNRSGREELARYRVVEPNGPAAQIHADALFNPVRIPVEIGWICLDREKVGCPQVDSKDHGDVGGMDEGGN